MTAAATARLSVSTIARLIVRSERPHSQIAEIDLNCDRHTLHGLDPVASEDRVIDRHDHHHALRFQYVSVNYAGAFTTAALSSVEVATRIGVINHKAELERPQSIRIIRGSDHADYHVITFDL